MRAARFNAPKEPVSLDEIPDAQPGPLEVTVRVRACGICASDLHFVHGEMPMPSPPPITMGHEASGVIESVGPDVPGWRPGDRVAMVAGKPCMACVRCVSGRFEECLNLQLMGFHYDGAWADLVTVPWSALARLPDEVSFEHGAIACDAVSTPYAALIDRGGLRPAERVGIWGIGGLGTHAVQIARLAGASFVAAVDPLAAARERTLALGADVALDPSDDVPNRIKDAGGPLDLALEMIGKARAVRQAMVSLRPGGRVVVAGQSLEMLNAGPILGVSVFQTSILGHLGYTKRHLEDVIALIASGRLDLSGSVSDVLPLERVNDGIDRLARKDEATVRILVRP